MVEHPTRVARPNKESLGRIAENQPGLLNLLVAYFVFEWRGVRIGSPSHGTDQTGMACIVPDYVGMWTDHGRNGVDVAMHYLLQCPERRGLGEPGYLTEWLATL